MIPRKETLTRKKFIVDTILQALNKFATNLEEEIKEENKKEPRVKDINY